MVRFLIMGWLISALLISITASAINIPKNRQDVINALQQASKICQGSCEKTCATQAETLKNMANLNGNIPKVKQGVKACRDAFANDSSKNSSAHSSIYMSLMMVDSNLNLIVNAEQAATSNQQSVKSAPLPKVDLSIHDQAGHLAPNKVKALYSHLSAHCESYMKSPGLVKICQSQCKETSTKLANNFDSVSTAQQKAKSAQGLQNITAQGSLRGLLMTIEGQLTGQAGGCIHYFNAYLNESQTTPEIVTTLIAAGQEIKAGKWPVKEAASLNLDELLVEEEVTIGDKVKQVVAVNAIENLTFSEAQKLFTNTDEFKKIQSSVNKNGFKLDQIKASMNKLEKLKNKIDSNSWERKALQFSEYGSQAEFIAALTQPCDMNYLTTFNQDSPWLIPNNQKSFALNYQLKSAYLHRLCFNELHNEITSKVASVNSAKQFNEWQKNNVSQAPLSGRATCRDCPPDRVMTPEQWLPNWSAYANNKQHKLNQTAKGNEKQTQYLTFVEQTLSPWIKQHQQEIKGALKVLTAAEKSSKLQQEMMGKFPDKLIESNIHQPPGNIYGFIQKAGTAGNDPRTGKPMFYQATLLKNIVTCEQGASLASELFNAPANTSYQTFLKATAAINQCADIFPAIAKTNFEDLDTAKSMGNNVVEKVIKQGNLMLSTHGAIYNDYVQFLGFDYLDLYGMQRVLHMLKNERDNHKLSDNTINEHFIALTKQAFNTLTNIDFDNKAAMQALLAKRAQAEKERQLASRLSGEPVQPAEKQNIIKPRKVSSNAYRLDYLGRCMRNGTASTYNCECAASAYEKQIQKAPVVNEYKFAQSNAFRQCADEKAIADTQAKQCTSMQKSGAFKGLNCSCFAKSYGNAIANIIKKSGSANNRQKNEIRQTAIKSCS
ncbi:hypothetical protein Q4489_15590 [Thalassotalea sp. 1_MG-2023]|uniref:hypothetical protein n=1 Tax=Thalassotalea sp. 1_MG-2023 TaxID=3062680 RepID=UPI0026E386EC|nr:hypothetical protein [Thalassotalea sp. 1_MG-2023]MDO6428439.1 hypothetical protein [Thalassotalea sp. 1_MG-2023]